MLLQEAKRGTVDCTYFNICRQGRGRKEAPGQQVSLLQHFIYTEPKPES